MAPKKITTRSSPAKTTTTTTPMSYVQIKTIITQGVADVLAERDATRSRNGEDNHDSGTGVRRQAPLARECTYLDFMKFQPLYFKGTEGVVELTQWFEKMETMLCISNYIMKNQIKFATFTLLGSALTWWNSHVKIELALMCARMFPEESDKIERYVDGLPDMIHGSVMASKPKTMQDAVEFATELMDKKIHNFVECQTENKRKQDDNQQQENKRQNTGRAYAVGPGEKKPYGDLIHCALNAIITMMVRVLPNATSATELAIWPVTVGVLLLQIIRETSLAMNVGIKGTIGVIERS
nr:hypothetical protein [Tanacetum cinerariifolium]